MKNIVTSFKINTLSSRKGLGVGLTCLLLTLGVGQMWGVYNYNWHGKVLYQVPTAWDLATNSTVQVGCARTTATNTSTYQFYFGTMTNVTNTQLYYASISANHSSWNQNEYIYFTANTNSYGSGDFKINVNACYTTPLDYGVANDAGAYLFTPSSNANGTAVSGSYQSNSTSWNYTQTIKYAVSENGATAAELTSGTVPANIAMSSYKFASGTYNSVSTSTANKSLTAGGSNYSATISAARTATTTLTVSNITSGYTFLGWYSAASGGTQLSTNLAYTYYPTAATTVYARFSHETTHSVDITYKCGSTTVSTATSQAIGQVTASSITAPTVAGYTFSSWTLGNGISNQSGSTTVNPISVKTLSSGTYTMQANYTEDLSTPYTIKGGTNITGNNWSTAYNMTKKSGHSTESVVYYTFNISSTNSGVSGTADNWSFKVIKDGSTWYGLSADAGTSYWWQRSTTANQNLASGDGGKNIQICADVAGPYEIKVDYSTPASPKVTVTFPTSYTLTYSIGSVAGNNGNISTSPTTASGSKVLSGNSVTLTGPAAKTGYTWKGWYTNAAGTTGKIDDTSRAITVTMNADKTLYACYTENNYTVTVQAGAGGSVASTSINGHKDTKVTLPTATANPGYYFTGWTTTSGSVSYDSQSSATAAKVYNLTAVATVQANFAPIWRIAGGNSGYADGADAMGDWSTDANQITNIATSAGVMTSGYVEVTLAANTDYQLKVYNASNNHWWGKTSTVTKITYTNQGTAVTLSDNTGNNQTFKTAAAGTYRFTWNVSNNQISITYPTSYTVTFGKGTGGETLSASGSTTGSITSGQYVAAGENITFTQTASSGYTFSNWYTTKDTGGSVVSTMGASDNVLDNIAANATVYSRYTPNNYTVILDVDEDHKGTITGATTNHTVTYNTVTTAIPNLPTAENGYGLMGYYTGQNGSGTKLINGDGTWIASVTGYTDGSKKWIRTSGVTLYAYYKKAEITGITFSPAAAEPGDEVTATAAISPTPVGPTTVCWEVRYASNDVLLDPQPAFTPETGASVSFTAPDAAVYKFTATLRTGSSCAAGDVLSTGDANLTVAGSHPVTIRYKHGDAVIKEEIIESIHATVPTAISAPDIIGYTFTGWTLGDGITLVSGTSSSSSITVTAIYDGVITANYNPKRMIYFYNTLGWSNVVVNFYRNDKYWGYGGDEGKGTGSNPSWTKDETTPFIKNGNMTQIAGTNIWYYDCEANSVSADVVNVAFTEYKQDNYNYFSYKYGTSTPNKVARRGDYHSTMPMFVPVEQDGVSMNGGQAVYYNDGYWMNYPENTGYKVKIYNWYEDTEPEREYYFPYSSDKKMPLKLDVEFNITDAKWFSIYRNDDVYLGVNAEMTQASHTNYRISNSSDKIKIQPSATGIYTYTLTFYDDGEKDGGGRAYGNMYHVTVDYPVSLGDYRILYKDNATWSQGTAHTESWNHPSDAINKISGEATEAKKDTVSLFVSYGASPTAKFQYVSAINPSTGAVTWTDVAGGTISLGSITKSGTYNFIISQPVGGASVSVEKIEAYTGNYYIRTDCAGNTKWDSYRAADHQMTYSEFSCSDANSFGEKFSHYFAHWCPAGMNVKFVIANDYSSCISDTLIQDVGNTYANINGDGFLNSDGNAEETANRFSANIRFMYNEATNKISRAYVASSTNPARWFLVLRSNSAIHGQDDDPIEDIGTGKPSVILDDKQNWIYEQTLKILPGSRFKLFACYADATPTEARAQYFRGNYATESWSNANTIELVGGDPASGYQLVRVLYDFKTNRLVCAWLPSGDISSEMDINADVMIIREHQEDATMITFTNASAKLTDVKTVYGTMKFNRWTLNNKSSESGHAVLPVANQKTIYERSLYFISFPFDVNLGEVFGFGTYGVHWIIENYDGENRAKNGYWLDSPPNWKYITSPKGYVLQANKGYILALDLDLMKDDNEEFWPHGIETVELFFPSAVTQSTIEQASVTIPAPDPAVYQCTINRPGKDGDRRIKDSYWRCLGVPSFANYTTTLSDGTSTITWQTADNTLPYLYAWNMENNKLTAQSTSTFAFKTMHAYLTQCSTAIVWSAASKPTPSIVARRASEEAVQDVEFRLQLEENGSMTDQTFIRFSTREDITAGFEFGNDLSKELNSGASNIYTFIGEEIAAANSLPLSTTQTTIVPVGLVANANADYTFSMPDGTYGVGVTLIDQETGIRTVLSALDYTVTLNKGTYENRFYLEISPVKETPTGLEQLPMTNDQSPIKKLLIDGILYIVRDGKIFDARGVMVK